MRLDLRAFPKPSFFLSTTGMFVPYIHPVEFSLVLVVWRSEHHSPCSEYDNVINNSMPTRRVLAILTDVVEQ